MAVLKEIPRVNHHVPRGAEDAVASKFATLLQKFVETRAEQDLAALIVPYVLSPFERGGKKHEGKASRTVHERLQAWHQAVVPPRCAESEGRRPPQRPPERGPGGLSEEAQRRVLAAIRERSLSKACKILQTSDLPPPEDPTNSLRALHPTGIPVPQFHNLPEGKSIFRWPRSKRH